MFNKILQLAEDSAKGTDNIKEGAIGSNGYGFVFRDEEIMSKHLQIGGSSKFYELGSMRRFGREYQKTGKFKIPNNSYENATEFDMVLAGAIKTLIPTLKTGGDEELFSAWVFVITPEGLKFPINLYYGVTRLALGGWDYMKSKKMFQNISDFPEIHDFPQKLKKIVNTNPFELSLLEKEDLAEALELALRKVPLTDFHGFYAFDHGIRIMGVREKEPFDEYITSDYKPKLELFKLFWPDEEEAEELYKELETLRKNNWNL